MSYFTSFSFKDLGTLIQIRQILINLEPKILQEITGIEYKKYIDD